MPEVPYPTAERFLVLINPYASGGRSPVVMRRRIASAFAEHDVPFDLVTPADPAEGVCTREEALKNIETLRKAVGMTR